MRPSQVILEVLLEISFFPVKHNIGEIFLQYLHWNLDKKKNNKKIPRVIHKEYFKNIVSRCQNIRKSTLKTLKA